MPSDQEHTGRCRTFEVVSPVFNYWISHGDAGMELAEDVDYWIGEAENPRVAKILAVRQWSRSKRSRHVQDCRGDGRSPFTGLRVYEVEAADA